MRHPLLTVITVTKNCAVTIERTLRSIEAIKNDEIEYLVIDGLSTDATLDIVRKHGACVDHLVSEPDTGIYNAMNKGICLARGRYVLFINGDDELIADGFPVVMNALRDGAVDIVCATTFVGTAEQPTERLIAKPWHLLFFNSIPHPSAFTSTKLLRKCHFREDLRIVSDYDFFLRAYLARRSFLILPVVTALHQRGGASGNVQRSTDELEMVRLDRLGWTYPLINGVAKSYRFLKKICAFSSNG